MVQTVDDVCELVESKLDVSLGLQGLEIKLLIAWLNEAFKTLGLTSHYSFLSLLGHSLCFLFSFFSSGFRLFWLGVCCFSLSVGLFCWCLPSSLAKRMDEV